MDQALQQWGTLKLATVREACGEDFDKLASDDRTAVQQALLTSDELVAMYAAYRAGEKYAQALVSNSQLDWTTRNRARVLIGVGADTTHLVKEGSLGERRMLAQIAAIQGHHPDALEGLGYLKAAARATEKVAFLGLLSRGASAMGRAGKAVGGLIRGAGTEVGSGLSLAKNTLLRRTPIGTTRGGVTKLDSFTRDKVVRAGGSDMLKGTNVSIPPGRTTPVGDVIRNSQLDEYLGNNAVHRGFGNRAWLRRGAAKKLDQPEGAFSFLGGRPVASSPASLGGRPVASSPASTSAMVGPSRPVGAPAPPVGAPAPPVGGVPKTDGGIPIGEVVAPAGAVKAAPAIAVGQADDMGRFALNQQTRATLQNYLGPNMPTHMTFEQIQRAAPGMFKVEGGQLMFAGGADDMVQALTRAHAGAAPMGAAAAGGAGAMATLQKAWQSSPVATAAGLVGGGAVVHELFD